MWSSETLIIIIIINLKIRAVTSGHTIMQKNSVKTLK